MLSPVNRAHGRAERLVLAQRGRKGKHGRSATVPRHTPPRVSTKGDRLVKKIAAVVLVAVLVGIGAVAYSFFKPPAAPNGPIQAIPIAQGTATATTAAQTTSAQASSAQATNTPVASMQATSTQTASAQPSATQAASTQAVATATQPTAAQAAG